MLVVAEAVTRKLSGRGTPSPGEAQRMTELVRAGAEHVDLACGDGGCARGRIGIEPIGSIGERRSEADLNVLGRAVGIDAGTNLVRGTDLVDLARGVPLHVSRRA